MLLASERLKKSVISLEATPISLGLYGLRRTRSCCHIGLLDVGLQVGLREKEIRKHTQTYSFKYFYFGNRVCGFYDAMMRLAQLVADNHTVSSASAIMRRERNRFPGYRQPLQRPHGPASVERSGGISTGEIPGR